MVMSMFLLSQVPIYGSFRNAFRGVRSGLVSKLDISHGLMDALCRRNVISELHISDIRVCISLLTDLSFLPPVTYILLLLHINLCSQRHRTVAVLFIKKLLMSGAQAVMTQFAGHSCQSWKNSDELAMAANTDSDS